MRSPNETTPAEKAPRLQRAAEVFLTGCRRLRARAWPQAKSSWRPAPPREMDSWGRRLDDEKHSLVAMVRGTEAEFLATGEGLGRLAQQLSGIQRECQALTDLTLGQAPDAAVQFAFQLLKKAEDLVLASDEQYNHVFTTFGEFQQRLAQLAKQHADLMQVLLPLDFITISFRIEASRHSPEVRQAFFTLADEVNRTVGAVRTAMEGQFAALEASERIARGLMAQVSTSIQRHRGVVSTTLQASRRQLQALSEALNGSGASAADLSHRNQAVTRHIGQIVMAQQCQDMTRQRIDHVGEAMEQMRSHLRQTPVTTDSADSDPRTFVYRAAQIQLHQVRSVFGELERAADGLTSGMKNMRLDAGAAAEAAVNVGRTALDAGIAQQCQSGIGQILAIVKQAVDQAGDVLAAFAPLQARFLDCTSQATGLAGEVRHAGLNAQVFAIHAPDGATLEVLAGRVRVISEEAGRQVRQMGAALNHTTEMVNNLRGRLEDFQVLGQTEQGILTRESALSREKLSELKAAIPVLIGRVTGQQEAFAASVESVLSKVLFPVTVGAASSRAIDFFQDLVTWSGAGGLGSQGASTSCDKIDQLKSSYTMDSERLAHLAATRPVAPPVGAAGLSPTIDGGDDWADESPAISDPANEPALALVAPGPILEKSAASTELGDNVDLF